MKAVYKIIAVLVVLLVFSTFSVVSQDREPPPLSIFHGETPYNVIIPYMRNNSQYIVKSGYLNFSGYGNLVSFVYYIQPFNGGKYIPRNYTGPLFLVTIEKVNQSLRFPFSEVSLSGCVSFYPNINTDYGRYVTTLNLLLTGLNDKNILNAFERGSFVNQNIEPGNMTVWVNITLTPVYEIGPYFIPGSTVTHSFRFVIYVYDGNLPH